MLKYLLANIVWNTKKIKEFLDKFRIFLLIFLSSKEFIGQMAKVFKL
jgi:hypothetical protein